MCARAGAKLGDASADERETSGVCARAPRSAIAGHLLCSQSGWQQRRRQWRRQRCQMGHLAGSPRGDAAKRHEVVAPASKHTDFKAPDPPVSGVAYGLPRADPHRRGGVRAIRVFAATTQSDSVGYLPSPTLEKSHAAWPRSPTSPGRPDKAKMSIWKDHPRSRDVYAVVEA